MILTHLTLGQLGTNCFIVGDDAQGPVVVIDPADEAERILAAVGERPVAAVVLTHGHFDHLGAVGALVAASGAPLLVHEDDAKAVISSEANGGAYFGFSAIAPAPDRLLRDGDVIRAGSLVLHVMHTPGHTPGGICLLTEGVTPPHLFSGDTLFEGSVGRTDFPGGSARTLARSVTDRLVPLDDATVVHPGHGPDTTIGRERKHNPFMRGIRSDRW